MKIQIFILSIYILLFSNISCVTSGKPQTTLRGGVPVLLPENYSSFNKIKKPVFSKDVLDLEKALELALFYNPSLKIYKEAIKLSEIDRMRAVLKPNPEISVEIEDVKFSSEPVEDLQMTFTVSRVFETGGKLNARLAKADLMTDIERVKFELEKRKLMLNVILQYYTAAYERQEVLINKEIAEKDKEIKRILKAKVEVGLLSPLQLKKFELAFKLRREERERVKRKLSEEQRNLAGYWGKSSPVFKSVKPCFMVHKRIKPLKELEKTLIKNPEYVYFDQLKQLRLKELELAKTGSTPDVTVWGGVRYYNNDRKAGGVLGVSVPLIFNKSYKADEAEAERKLNMDMLNKHNKLLDLKFRLKNAYVRLAAMHKLALKYINEYIPEAEQTFKKVKESYRAGKLSYLEVLDAQSIINEVHHKFHLVLKEYAFAFVKVNFLTGKSPAVKNEVSVNHCM